MNIKFNGGNLALLCDQCSVICAMGDRIPSEYRTNHNQQTYIFCCEECKQKWLEHKERQCRIVKECDMDAIIKNKISKRQECNKELLRIFTEIVEKNPELRFGQILFNFQFVKWEDVNKRIKILDPFYEESVDTLNRVKHLMDDEI